MYVGRTDTKTLQYFPPSRNMLSKSARLEALKIEFQPEPQRGTISRRVRGIAGITWARIS